MPAIPLNSVVHCEKCEKQNKWNTKRSRGRTQRRQKRMKTKKKNTNVHMLRCLECAILHLRDFVPHTHTVKQTVKHTGTLEQWNTEAHTHTHAKRGKSIRNQSTRQGFHSVRKQTVDSRQARPGWGFLVLFGRSFGGGLGCFSGASFFLRHVDRAPAGRGSAAWFTQLVCSLVCFQLLQTYFSAPPRLKYFLALKQTE